MRNPDAANPARLSPAGPSPEVPSRALLKRALRVTAVVGLVAAVAAPVAVAAPAPVPEAGPTTPPAATAALTPGTTGTSGTAGTTGTAGTAGSPAPITAPGAPGTARVSALKGEARVGYEVGEDEVRVSVNARSTYGPGSIPTRSWGTFRISHRQQGKLAWGEFAVDCLTTGGPNATVTGRLVRTSPDHPWTKLLEPHTRMGVSLSVPARGTSYVGLSGATAKGSPLLTRCMAPAADMPVIEGGYTLRDRKQSAR
ncbi:hypothetical protein ACFYVL_10775 [Streptomyces sp. NPDC004111]|uniref:hypothetical protein n=1 Tax=Streptomyces sp. NPDC004111 TaxID=3364690 RepID=UPI003697107D